VGSENRNWIYLSGGVTASQIAGSVQAGLGFVYPASVVYDKTLRSQSVSLKTKNPYDERLAHFPYELRLLIVSRSYSVKSGLLGGAMAML
jgi:hypothetical protein